jgi:hypothetical protein
MEENQSLRQRPAGQGHAPRRSEGRGRIWGDRAGESEGEGSDDDGPYGALTFVADVRRSRALASFRAVVASLEDDYLWRPLQTESGVTTFSPTFILGEEMVRASFVAPGVSPSTLALTLWDVDLLMQIWPGLSAWRRLRALDRRRDVVRLAFDFVGARLVRDRDVVLDRTLVAADSKRFLNVWYSAPHPDVDGSTRMLWPIFVAAMEEVGGAARVDVVMSCDVGGWVPAVASSALAGWVCSDLTANLLTWCTSRLLHA